MESRGNRIFRILCELCTGSRGLAVHQGSLHDYPGNKESIDAITMWDYLEHSSDPLGDLSICSSLLKQGGVILLSIPNVDSWSYRLLGKKWIGFKNIEHLYFFSRNTIEKLARAAGLTMENSFYHGKYVSLSFFLSRIQYYILSSHSITWSKKLLPMREPSTSHFTLIPMIS